MKIPIMAATLVLAASAFAQDQSMPGMEMPAKSVTKTTPQQRHTTTKKKVLAPNVNQSMPGMNPHQNMQGMDTSQKGDKPVQGMDMEHMQKMHGDAAPAAVTGSITHPTSTLQEPEDPAHLTGSNLPAPELLRDALSRQPKSLPDFIGMADKSNPTIAQANALVRRSAAQARQAGLYPNPTLGYQGEQIRGGAYGGGEQGAFLQQNIVVGGKLGLRRNIYDQQKHSDEIGVEEQTIRVHSDVTREFYSSLAAQEMVSVRRRLLRVTQDAVETVHQLANVGQADAPDILQTEVEAEQAKVDYVNAQRDFLQSYRTLAAMAGQQDMTVSPLQGDLEHPPELDTQQQVASIVATSPEVRRAQQEVTIAEARLRDARREAVPDIQLRAGEQYNFEHITENPGRATGPQSFASAGVSLPLWNHNQGNKSAATAEVERARQAVVRVQRRLQHEAAPLAERYESSRFEVDRYKTQLLPRAQRAYELYLTKYQNMAQAYPQVLVSQRTLFQLQVSYLMALRETWTNAVALQNFTLSGGLDEPRSSGSSSTSINIPGASGGVE